MRKHGVERAGRRRPVRLRRVRDPTLEDERSELRLPEIREAELVGDRERAPGRRLRRQAIAFGCRAVVQSFLSSAASVSRYEEGDPLGSPSLFGRLR
jgi:hypothetical protein